MGRGLFVRAENFLAVNTDKLDRHAADDRMAVGFPVAVGETGRAYVRGCAAEQAYRAMVRNVTLRGYDAMHFRMLFTRGVLGVAYELRLQVSHGFDVGGLRAAVGIGHSTCSAIEFPDYVLRYLIGPVNSEADGEQTRLLGTFDTDCPEHPWVPVFGDTWASVVRGSGVRAQRSPPYFGTGYAEVTWAAKLQHAFGGHGPPHRLDDTAST